MEWILFLDLDMAAIVNYVYLLMLHFSFKERKGIVKLYNGLNMMFK